MRPAFVPALPLPTLNCSFKHSTRRRSSSPLSSAPRPPAVPLASLAPSLEKSDPDAIFACPRCRRPAAPSTSRACSNCGSRFLRTASYIDLTVGNDIGPLLQVLRSLVAPLAQETFRSPAVAWLYERGWRSRFAVAGFPGIEQEFEMVKEFFGECGGVVADVSCGSGLMARRLAQCGLFDRVLAVDYSEAMLVETANRMRNQETHFEIIRADAASLPFGDAKLNFVHVGAALHCWPSLQDGLAEVHRVLKPGGKFFATTFLWGAYGVSQRLRAVGPGTTYRFFEREELVYLMNGAGFRTVDVEVIRRCVIIRCEK